MATKILTMLKRKPGMTFEAFRDHYENSHAKLGERFFGPIMKEYRRNYCAQGVNLMVPPVEGEMPFDCITELVLKDGMGIADLTAAGSDPEARRLLTEDEERFLDRAACRVSVVEVHERSEVTHAA